MSLSDEELARLREIEALTVAQDPRFAAQLDLDRVTRHDPAALGWALMLWAAVTAHSIRSRRK